jgi:hypothetical protein
MDCICFSATSLSKLLSSSHNFFVLQDLNIRSRTRAAGARVGLQDLAHFHPDKSKPTARRNALQGNGSSCHRRMNSPNSATCSKLD